MHVDLQAIAAGIAIDTADNDGRTALATAAQHGHADIVEALVPLLPMPCVRVACTCVCVRRGVVHIGMVLGGVGPNPDLRCHRCRYAWPTERLSQWQILQTRLLSQMSSICVYTVTRAGHMYLPHVPVTCFSACGIDAKCMPNTCMPTACRPRAYMPSLFLAHAWLYAWLHDLPHALLHV